MFSPVSVPLGNYKNIYYISINYKLKLNIINIYKYIIQKFKFIFIFNKNQFRIIYISGNSEHN